MHLIPGESLHVCPLTFPSCKAKPFINLSSHHRGKWSYFPSLLFLGMFFARKHHICLYSKEKRETTIIEKRRTRPQSICFSLLLIYSPVISKCVFSRGYERARGLCKLLQITLLSKFGKLQSAVQCPPALIHRGCSAWNTNAKVSKQSRTLVFCEWRPSLPVPLPAPIKMEFVVGGLQRRIRTRVRFSAFQTSHRLLGRRHQDKRSTKK